MININNSCIKYKKILDVYKCGAIIIFHNKYKNMKSKYVSAYGKN